MSPIDYAQIEAAAQRISPYATVTPIFQSRMLNSWFGHEIYFKAECLQRGGAFKFRGAINTLSWLQEQGKLPCKVVANSSGNHAQAVALAANLFGIEAEIYTAKNVSKVKAAATEYYGATLNMFETRAEADHQVKLAAEQDGVYWLPPFNHQQVIAGQGTVAYEALQQVEGINAIFAPCGGGGLLSGTLLATRHLAPEADVVGVEPELGNDAMQSLQQGKIVRLPESPKTLADGAATLAVGDLTFPYLQQLDDFYTVEEEQIAYWTQWLQHLLKLHVEPTSAMSMAAVAAWLQQQNTPQKVMVILSGGNIDNSKMQQLWQQDYLQQMPILVD
ncbi:serine/threonine dehydratase [Neptunicella marina]|uniref:Serine/threonine dehydratase n=1 Tax=Neptunicella marina TaxID=2125989 RepID=A0A8J6IX01_9ALTE|nr:serine/threonine dehydratase [Neptunicella marina]MBC3766908.1 serine/threonine dehydratase [Neptunicella marina]